MGKSKHGSLSDYLLFWTVSQRNVMRDARLKSENCSVGATDFSSKRLHADTCAYISTHLKVRNRTLFTAVAVSGHVDLSSSDLWEMFLSWGDVFFTFSWAQVGVNQPQVKRSITFISISTPPRQQGSPSLQPDCDMMRVRVDWTTFLVIYSIIYLKRRNLLCLHERKCYWKTVKHNEVKLPWFVMPCWCYTDNVGMSD